jgi:dihydrofolate synthase/folylpolyglutamate synthase
MRALVTSLKMSINLGLERTARTLAGMGDPHHKFPSIHVAGTNGKGSTCTLLEAALLHAGARVGKFTSPYLTEPRDAVSIGGRAISPQAWEDALALVDAHAAPGLTPFERWTAAAFQGFAASGVEIAVVEVGVGGGSDATNVLPPPLIALITPIAMDHVELLGPTQADIARHKAGIIKAGCGGALTSPGQAPEVQAVLEARAAGEGLALVTAPLLPWLSRGILALEGGAQQLPLALRGDFQATNASLAWAALQALGGRWPILRDVARMGEAWGGVRWRGRLEVVHLGQPPLRYLLDGGHNAHAMGAVARELALGCGAAQAGGGEGRLVLLFSCGASRNARENIGLLLGGVVAGTPRLAGVTILTLPYTTPEGMPWAACAQPKALATAALEVAQSCLPPSVALQVHALGSLQEALAFVAVNGDLGGEGVCRAVCGSLYLVADVARLQASAEAEASAAQI